MALVNAVEGSRRTAQVITWKDRAGNLKDLTGATITARIKSKNHGNLAVTSDGTFALTDAANGEFSWTYGAADVAAHGCFQVQFKATFVDTTFDLTELTDWNVIEAI